MVIDARSCLAAGVALAGAAAVGIAPVMTAAPARASETAYTLAAVSTAAAGASMANVAANVLNLVMSMPAWEVQAMGRLADAMIATGSWQVWGPTNVFGFDEEDPPKLAALIDMIVPVQPVSSAIGDQLNWWARANLPMNAGCAAAHGACPDPKAMLRSMFTAPLSQLYQGYQFPAVTNPFTGSPTSWSGQYVKLDRGAAVTALREYLTGPPAGVATVAPGEAARTIQRLGTSVSEAFKPFVQNSQWFDQRHTVFAPVFRALAPALCASCEADPYDNPWLKNYSPKPAQSGNAAQAVRAGAISAEPDVAQADTPQTTAVKQNRRSTPAASSVRVRPARSR